MRRDADSEGIHQSKIEKKAVGKHRRKSLAVLKLWIKMSARNAEAESFFRDVWNYRLDFPDAID